MSSGMPEGYSAGGRSRHFLLYNDHFEVEKVADIYDMINDYYISNSRAGLALTDRFKSIFSNC